MDENMLPVPEKNGFDWKKILPYIIIIILLLILGALYLQKTQKAPVIMMNSQAPTQSAQPAEKIDFNNYGPAPDFTKISHWLNSNPLTIASLRGKIVLVDFWAYSCINCIRTLPYVTKLYDTYKDKGLVVVGVHTPEFAFEKETPNVSDAIKRFKINYPVAQDNDYSTWQAYNNQYWPAEYLIDQSGQIVYTHFGEGNYDRTEQAVEQLLMLNSKPTLDVTSDSPEFMKVKSPEMYFGTDRLANLNPAQKPSGGLAVYSLPSSLPLNTFALEGAWKFDAEKAGLGIGNGKIKLHFSAGKVYLVAKSDNPVTLKIIVDGVEQKSVTVSASQLYTLYDSEDYKDHVIEIDIPDGGFDAFTFTFG